MATKNFKAMSTKKLNTLLETATESEKVQIQKVLDDRASIANAEAPAPITQGVTEYVSDEPLTEAEEAAIAAAESGEKAPKAEKAPKMSDEERQRLAADLKANVMRRCEVVPFNSIEWVGGYVSSIIEDKRNNKVLYGIKTDDGKRIVKAWDSSLIILLDKTQVIEKKERVKKEKSPDKVKVEVDKTPWTDEEIKAEIAKCTPEVGKKVSYPKFKLMATKEEAEKQATEEPEIESGRIVSLVPDKRSKRILFKIEIDSTDADAPKKYSHKVAGLATLTISEMDEEGQKLNDVFVTRTTKAFQRKVATTPQAIFEAASQNLEKAKEALAKAQELIAKRENELAEAKAALDAHLASEISGEKAEEVTTEEIPADNSDSDLL